MNTVAVVLVLSTVGQIHIPTVHVTPTEQWEINRGPVYEDLLRAVHYSYDIGMTEVTNSQYTDFLNSVDPTGANAHGLWHPGMGGVALGLNQGGISRIPEASHGSHYRIREGLGQRPVVWLSGYDVSRFANWMTSGDTESGTYDLANPHVRLPGAVWAIPTFAEWQRACRYRPQGWPGMTLPARYCVETPVGTLPTDAQANIPPLPPPAQYFYDPLINQFEDVGSYPYPSHWGTFDQEGNAFEYIEDSFANNRHTFEGSAYNLHTYSGDPPSSYFPSAQDDIIGMRLVRIAPLREDLNQDESVDAADAGVMFSNWGTPGMGDITRNEIVDAADAGRMFSVWTGDSGPRTLVPEPSSYIVASLLTAFARCLRPM